MGEIDREHHLTRREFERVTHQDCPCRRPEMMSYDELMGAFKEAIRQRDTAETAARQMAESEGVEDLTDRRLASPWQIIEHAESYEVRDATGTITLAFLYFEDEPGRQRAMRRLSRDEARRVASHIAKIPEYATRSPRTDESSVQRPPDDI